MKVLMSIKPEFVEEIIQGNKKFEYRKKLFKRADVTSVVVYATKPYGKVVGEFEIEQILIDTPNSIWKQTKKQSGISKHFFNSYFKDHTEGVAIQIKEFIEYEQHLELFEFDNNLKAAPQSFCYTEGGF
ncbi:ASCH domain-containing protein [Listeria innocua]|uniref:ASCH domain-containing protein n=1 Tax=Listeria monocytogenes TaxID=1639 RepID=UPI0010B37CF0|nr:MULTISPECIES: ASCH domain-containing protein [Listeria]EAC6254404.1 ASCH domain-containing protein [Listeria monocytogenes]EIL5148098.1 ASCH domain-containing protein [Listeria innocua]EIL5150906.1 ASCH domain-containing protein [Listeria innocua]EIL5178671.1 ASCH domain-containing protein [Listeria innocua]EIL5207650.1 ASCH domain-containing protein [Listeria innocua]